MAQMTSTRTQSISIGHLLNEHVSDVEGRDIGRVEDLVLDQESGSMDFAVVRFGGFLGMGGRYHLIPWELLTIDPERRAFTMDVTKEKVERAPAFDSGNVPDTDDSEYMNAVFNYWGVNRQDREQSTGWQQTRDRERESRGRQQESYGGPEQGYDRRGQQQGSSVEPESDVDYGSGQRGPERRQGDVPYGQWTGSERRAGW